MSQPDKTQLTPDENVKVFIANRIHGTHIDVLAMLFDVNSGRVSEAITAIEYAANNVKKIYQMAIAEKASGS